MFSDPQSVAFFHQFKADFPALNIKIPFLTVWETINHKPLKALVALQKPLLIVAAGEDGVNPVSESQRLFAQANEPKQLHIEPGRRITRCTVAITLSRSCARNSAGLHNISKPDCC
ncbi:lysophospholipase [Shewanella sp. KCT]|uniref:lysophospholipase n=1 Tax=Shewanella sp. KCT TaxID=2569535 RepID=UPI001182249F|nr:lysophospholipase [Shewanella sp. KCT]TVP14870.1 hypothetical protein AYI87_07715 [Shewanella sp. KCT]